MNDGTLWKSFARLNWYIAFTAHSRSIVWGKFIGLQSPSFSGEREHSSDPPYFNNAPFNDDVACTTSVRVGAVKTELNQWVLCCSVCVCACWVCVEHDAALRRILCRAMLNNLMVFSAPCDLCTSKCRICVALAMCDSLSAVVNARTRCSNLILCEEKHKK